MALIWFRYHADALDNPRVQKLPADLFRLWVNCQCILAQEGASAVGKMPPIDDCAYRLRMSVADVEKAMDKLVDYGLMKSKIETVCNGNEAESETVCNGNGSQKSLEIFPQKKQYFLRNWEKKQYKSDVSTERVKRYRNGKRNVTETSPDQIRSDTDQIRSEGGDLSSGEGKKPRLDVRRQNYGGQYDVLRHLDDDELAAIRSEFGRWDIQFLAGQYNSMVHSGRFQPPDKPQLAFPAWIKVFTKGKNP